MGCNVIETFFGKPYSYWLELEERKHITFTEETLLQEIHDLRGKVSFYEDRIDQLYRYKEKIDGNN